MKQLRSVCHCWRRILQSARKRATKRDLMERINIMSFGVVLLIEVSNAAPVYNCLFEEEGACWL